MGNGEDKRGLRIEIDPQAGCCFGVVRAISKAEEALGGGERVLCLGDIVHNRVEMSRLAALGLRSAGLQECLDAKEATVLIRAHGEPPSTFEALEGRRVVDATCPVVASLQKRVKQAHEEMQRAGGQVVLLGKRGHAEVEGLVGQVGGDVAVIESVEELDGLDFSRPIHLLSQTTQSLGLFERVSGEILRRAADPKTVKIDDTICRRVSGREQQLGEFARQFDAVLFVAGKKSSNGMALFEVCKKANPKSYFIEDENDIEFQWLGGCNSIGISGATSTPEWQMERIKEYIYGLP